MRRPAVLVLGLGMLALAGLPAHAMTGALPAAPTSPGPIVKVGYYCSPGFVASYGRCIATADAQEVDLYLNDPAGYDNEVEPPPVRHRHRRHGIHERY